VAASNPEFDADCIRRIQAGEKQLFHALMQPCERPIYFLLMSLLRNETEAEDAAQDTVIKVYQNLKNFRGDSQFRTWVLSIARNEGLGRLRKAASRREDSLDAETDEQTGDSDKLEGSSLDGAGAEGTGRAAAAGDRGAAGDLP
jgi:RNA polymerase sigma-70 factor (ECF subfamily)